MFWHLNAKGTLPYMTFSVWTTGLVKLPPTL